MDALAARFVAPFYLRVLHGNLVAPTSEDEEAVLITEMKSVSRDVTVEICQELWSRGWREGLMASWWGGRRLAVAGGGRQRRTVVDSQPLHL
jgi:hypothetical protein